MQSNKNSSAQLYYWCKTSCSMRVYNSASTSKWSIVVCMNMTIEIITLKRISTEWSNKFWRSKLIFCEWNFLKCAVFPPIYFLIFSNTKTLYILGILKLKVSFIYTNDPHYNVLYTQFSFLALFFVLFLSICRIRASGRHRRYVNLVHSFTPMQCATVFADHLSYFVLSLIYEEANWKKSLEIDYIFSCPITGNYISQIVVLV